MGFFQSFDKKEDVKKEDSTSKLDDLPPPPLPDKGDAEIKEAVKEKNEEKKELVLPPLKSKEKPELKEEEKNKEQEKSPIPPPPQFKEPKEKKLPEAPKLEEPKEEKKLPEAPKPEEAKTGGEKEEPKKGDFAPKDESKIPKPEIKPMDIPKPEEPMKSETALGSIPKPELPGLEKTSPEAEKMPVSGQPQLNEMSLPFGNMAEPEPQVKETIKMTVPDTLPEMPLFDSNSEESSYTFSPQPSVVKDIPFFSNVEVQPQKDEFEELFNLPVMDVEENTESFGQFKYRDLKKPLFIRTDHYSQILTNIDTMKTYVEESSDKISMLNNLKRNADIEHKKYKELLEDVQRKLIYIDRVLFD